MSIFGFCALNDELVARLRPARLVTLGRHAPRRHRVTATRGLAFTAAERVIDRVHRDAAHVRALAQPAAAAGLADRHVLVIDVADLADRREAVLVDLANLARRHLDRDVVAFLGHDLHAGAGAARHLPALAGLQLDVVHHRALRDVLQRQAVARQDVDVVAGDDRVADLQPDRLQDVALLAVGIGDQRDARRAVRVVLDRRHLAGNVGLVALEVDDAIEALVPAAAPPHRLLAGAVAAARGLQGLGQRAVRLVGRDLVERQHRHLAAARRRRLVFADWHDRSLMRPSRKSGSFSPFAQRDVRLLPIGAAADELALALQLAARDRGANVRHLGAEQLLDGARDRRSCWRRAPLRTRSVLPSSRMHRGLLGDERPADDIGQFHDYAPSAASSFSSAAGREHHLLRVRRRRAP